ncbi:MAG: hypothetical protein FWF80_09105 [Defluviitaleaceae bacterium]|nr:hypothetical protein [Defluviitaleaceae bacterium]
MDRKEHMNIKLTVGKTQPVSLTSFDFSIESNSSKYGKANNPDRFINLRGALVRNQALVQTLRKWSEDANVGDDIYKKVTVKVLHKNRAIRTFEFENAYIVSYSECIDASTSGGHFVLKLSQKLVKGAGITSDSEM